MTQFECPGPVTLALRVSSGVVDIHAEPRDTAEVDVTVLDDHHDAHDLANRTRVEIRSDTLVVATPEHPMGWLFRRSSRVRISVRVPIDSRLQIGSASAHVSARGRYAIAHVTTATGNVAVQHVTGDMTARSASGDITVDRLDGAARVHTASGDVTLGVVGGDVSAHAASGDIRLGQMDASVQANTGSGDIDLAVARCGVIRLRSASGDVSVGVAPDTRVWLDLNTTSGEAYTDLDVSATGGQQAPDLRIHARTISGDVHVRPASAHGQRA